MLKIKSYTDCFDEYNGATGTHTVEDGVLMLGVGSGYSIVYSNMVIVTYLKNGHIYIYDDEVSTTSVRNKINKYTPTCINAIQRDHVLFIEFYGVCCPFVSGCFNCNPEKKAVYYEDSSSDL